MSSRVLEKNIHYLTFDHLVNQAIILGPIRYNLTEHLYRFHVDFFGASDEMNNDHKDFEVLFVNFLLIFL